MHDLRLAFRQLTKSPGFTVLAVLTLALGIGACTAIFSVINAVVLRPLPFPDSEQLVQIWTRRLNGAHWPSTGLEFKYWRDENTMLDSLAVVEPVYRTLTGGRSPERIRGINVTANYLHVLRVHPLLGRGFAPDADQVGGANDVVILSHAMWQTRFGGDPGIIDRTIVLNQTPHLVVGVLGPGALPRDDALFVLPVVIESAELLSGPRNPWTAITARLKPGVAPAEAESELTAISAAHAGEFPVERRGAAAVVPLREQLTGAARPAMFLFAIAGALVLLIACANVANLLLARATARTKEMAVRSALGAGARRIIRQVLTENIVLALCGGAVGVLLALFCVDFLGSATRAVDPSFVTAGGGALAAPRVSGLNLRLTGGELPGMLQPRVDWLVLAFASVIAVGTGMACGLFPALRASRCDVNRDLKDAGRGSTSGGRARIQSVLVAVEVGLTVVLLIGAGLFLRSFAQVLAVDPGFNPREAVYFDLAFPQAVYPERGDVIRFEEAVVARLAEQPGITAVGAATNVPFGLGGWGGSIGLAEESDRKLDVNTGIDYVQGNFFGAMDIPLRQGRLFRPEDNNPAAPRVGVINEVLARTLFAAENPLGRRVTTYGNVWEVVGVVGEIRNRSLEGPPRSHFYAPHAFDARQASVVVRSDLPMVTLRDVITKTVRTIDADQPVAIRTLASGVAQSLEGRQSMLMLVNAFAAVALVLACLGIYGVMAYTIGQRQRELGIRMALGASQPNVIALVLRDGMRLALVGLGAGLIAAIAGARLIASMLFGVSAHDPVVFTAVTLALAAIALFACWLPARRAAHADPMQALRAE
jgi:ABC-type antimicrobial peptide transport system permease subunit